MELNRMGEAIPAPGLDWQEGVTHERIFACGMLENSLYSQYRPDENTTAEIHVSNMQMYSLH